MKRLIILWIFLLIRTVPAQTDTLILETRHRILQLPFGLTRSVPEEYPVLGVALSGGGARGIAQIGVLQAFEEASIPIEIITGTSMGSIIGGLYCSGYTPSELRGITVSTAWGDLLSTGSSLERRTLFIDQKLTDDRAVVKLRLQGLTPVLPSSVNDGLKLMNYLTLLTVQSPFRFESDFSKLQSRFSAVCTNLLTGKPYVFTHGSLSLALRASSSVSFFLAPVEFDSALLVDGGLVANTPVDILLAQHPDFVVAVNTTSPLHPKSLLTQPWVIADQVISIPMILVNQDQLSRADIVITPDLGTHSAADFSNIDWLIEAGYRSAVPKAESLKVTLDEMFRNEINKNAALLPPLLPPDSANIACSFLASIAGDSLNTGLLREELYRLESENMFANLCALVTFDSLNSRVQISGTPVPFIQMLELSGTEIVPSDTVLRMMSTLTNQPFKPEIVSTVLKRVLRYYRDQGYALASIDSVSFSEETGCFQVFIDEGIISDVVILGNAQTDETVIRREFPLAAGDHFQTNLVRQGLTNIQSTGLFDNVLLSVEKNNKGTSLILEVKEKQSSLVRIGFMASSENTPRFGIDIRDENVFGTATEFAFTSFLSPRLNSFIIEHRANRVFDSYFTYKLNAYYRWKDYFLYKDDSDNSEKTFSRSPVGEYKHSYLGFSFALGTQVQRFGNLMAEIRFEQTKTQNIEKTPVSADDIFIASFRISLSVDTQDRVPYPQRGIRLNAYNETAQNVLGSSIGYSISFIDFFGCFTVNRIHNWSLHAQLGYGDKTLPLTHHFSLGGMYSFYGMKEDEFRGRQLFSASFAYRYKLPVQLFFDTYISLRYDIGSTWEQPEQIRLKDLRHGAGLMISFDTPIGPADFAFGRSFIFTQGLPENKVKLSPWTFYFSIGYFL